MSSPAPGLPPLEVLVRDTEARDVARDLLSMTVHATHDGRATAEVELVSRDDVLPVEIGGTRLTVRVSDAVIDGPVTESELRMPEAAAPSLVLHAEGVIPAGGGEHTLRWGIEIQSGSVRDDGAARTARCVTAHRVLWPGDAVQLTTSDARFNGTFTVVEVWHRFDSAHGWSTELVANHGQASTRPS